ncbi:MAG: hypothetical protein H6Q02_1281 [Acidobacteria bacterium]|nr:hypothetical protein [Acidobacteriota bacterium]
MAGRGGTVRRDDRHVPVVTLVLAGVVLAAFVAFGRGVGAADEAVRAAENAVWRQLAAAPWLEPEPGFLAAAVPPIWRSALAVGFEARRAAAAAPDPATQGAARHEHADLVSAWRAALAEHPFSRRGLVPTKPSIAGVVTGLVLFPGWPGVVVGLLFLALAGGVVESAAGRVRAAALFLAGAATGLAVPALMFPSSWFPIVGAGAGVAALVGGATVRAADCTLPAALQRYHRARPTLPALVLLPAWLALTSAAVLLYRTADGRESFAGAIAVALGAAIGGATGRRREVVAAPAPTPTPPELTEGLDLLALGETARAREVLKGLLARDPGRPEANLAMWQSYLQDGMPAQGAEFLVRVIDAHLRRHDPERAWEHWRELLDRTGNPGPSALRWRIAGELRTVDPVRARDVLTHLAADPGAGIASDKAKHRLAAELKPEASAAAVVTEQPVAGAAVAAAPPERGDADLEDIGLPRLDSPSSAAARPLVLEACRLEQLQADGLVVRGEDGDTRFVPYRSLEVVAVGGIAEAAKPYVVLDLVPAAEPARPRRGFRLVSTQFDPRRFVAQAGLTQMEAFRELVRVITGASGARLLPGPEALRRIPVFATAASYDREVLGLDRRA